MASLEIQPPVSAIRLRLRAGIADMSSHLGDRQDDLQDAAASPVFDQRAIEAFETTRDLPVWDVPQFWRK